VTIKNLFDFAYKCLDAIVKNDQIVDLHMNLKNKLNKFRLKKAKKQRGRVATAWRLMVYYLAEIELRNESLTEFFENAADKLDELKESKWSTYIKSQFAKLKNVYEERAILDFHKPSAGYFKGILI
jgi:hypothetical protein